MLEAVGVDTPPTACGKRALIIASGSKSGPCCNGTNANEGFESLAMALLSVHTSSSLTCRETCLACALLCRVPIGSMKPLVDNILKLGEATTVEEDPNSPSDILKRVPDEFLQDHLTER